MLALRMGAVAAGFLFRTDALTFPQALLILGGLVMACSFFSLAVTFKPEVEKEVEEEFKKAMARIGQSACAIFERTDVAVEDLELLV